jgi:hypothetical protein
MLVAATALMVAVGLLWQAQATSTSDVVDRVAFRSFPVEISGWKGTPEFLDESITRVLGADDYFLSTFVSGESRVSFFLTFYEKQTGGAGIHSPEVCLPRRLGSIPMVAP